MPSGCLLVACFKTTTLEDGKGRIKAPSTWSKHIFLHLDNTTTAVIKRCFKTQVIALQATLLADWLKYIRCTWYFKYLPTRYHLRPNLVPRNMFHSKFLKTPHS